MWRHPAGWIDFDGPLLRLWRRGWRFREYAPIVGARDGGRWSVVGVHRGARVRGDRPERKEAWAEAVRLALVVAVLRRSLLAVPSSGTVGGRRPPSRSPRLSPRRRVGTAIDGTPRTVGDTASGTWRSAAAPGSIQHECPGNAPIRHPS